MYELFTLQELGKQGTETSAIFAGTGSEVKLKKKHHNHHRDGPSQKEKNSAIHPERKDSVTFSAEKLEKMKLLAKKLSAEISKKVPEPETDLSKKNLEPKEEKMKKESLEFKTEKNSEPKSESKINNESHELSKTKGPSGKDKKIEKNNKEHKSKTLEHSLKHSKKPKKRKIQGKYFN